MNDKEKSLEERFLHFHFSAAEAMQQFQKIPIELTQQEIDNLVLSTRSSLENATLEEIGQRVIELNTAFITLQLEAKKTKQKHIVALEKYAEKSELASPEEIKAEKTKGKLKKKSEDDWNALEKMMEQMGGKKE